MSSASFYSFLDRFNCFNKKRLQLDTCTVLKTRRKSCSLTRETSVETSLDSSFPTNNTDTPQELSRIKQGNIRFCYSSETDIGGGKKNEDETFIWTHETTNSVVFGVIDGHGHCHGGNQGLGMFAAQQCKEAMINWLDHNFSSLPNDPAFALRNLFTTTHNALFVKIYDHLQSLGYEVLAKEGYLIYRSGKSSWKSVSGGAGCSVVVLLQGGSKMYTANVGDCTGIMSMNGKLLSSDILKPLYPPNQNEELKFNSGELDIAASRVISITREHSPACPREFRWMRNKRACQVDPSRPFLRCMYEGFSPCERDCNDIFTVDNNKNLLVTGMGQYHKNVRGEWATRVIVPRAPGSTLHGSLSVTRSLGDFHMQSCGISHTPDIFEVTLMKCFENEEVGIIILCSDGVWDNWYFEEVADFFLQTSLVTSASESTNANFQISQFMQANHKMAEQNFGSKADNATGIVCYLFKST